jgi:predicted AAA+ superfamily ATPase
MRLPKNLLYRERYIKRIEPFVDTNLIKVLVGQRRVGKSYLLYQIIKMVRSKNPDANIIYLSMEDFSYSFIKSAKDLNDYIVNRLILDESNYVLIDEVQEIPNFEKVLRSLLIKDNVDVYVTGSNAKMLSSEIATMLSGRYIEFPVFSLSYQEFLKFNGIKDSDDNLSKYLKFGGMPYLLNLALRDDATFEYLRNLYSTIIYKDVVARYQIRNIAFLEKLVSFLADNVGSLFSANKISDFLKSQKINISSIQIQNYLEHLCNAFIIKRAKRMDIFGKKVFEVGDKFYFENLGIRHAIVGYKAKDIAKIIENVVCNHLLYLGYDIKVGKLNDKEIDFVCEKDKLKLYVQVCYKFNNENTIKREFENLKMIKDNYPKLVVSMDKFMGKDYEGIRHVYLRDFLKMEEI